MNDILEMAVLIPFPMIESSRLHHLLRSGGPIDWLKKDKRMASLFKLV